MSTILAMGELQQTRTSDAKEPGPTMVGLLPASVLAYIWPPANRIWTRATMSRAIMVAVVNTLCAFLWMYAFAVLGMVWKVSHDKEWHPGSEWHWSTYEQAASLMKLQWSAQWHFVTSIDRISVVASFVMGIALSYAVPFFMLLPFAARPGANKPCMKHVLKTTLIGSGLVHWWGIAYALVLFLHICRGVPLITDDYARAVWPLLMTFALLCVWHTALLINAARRDYRTPADLPKEHDPWCDVCGYNLTGIPATGRCPECGKPIEESLGTSVRPLTPWEQRPSIFNLGVILRQLKQLITQPRRLFYSMPTLAGQPQAQRWLFWSMLAMFLAAIPIVPALFIVLKAEWTGSAPMAAISGTLAMCVVWTAFGLMMVGIETGGIATFSRMRGHPGGGVYLAAAAKVTCYSSILMVAWVLLGGIQLVIYTYLSSKNQDIALLFHLPKWWNQIILGASLGITHVGGLLWYELTVYRGVKAIQYAAK